jgi:hypothetical protein
MYLRKVYIRHKEACPDSHNTFAALDGFQQMGVETAPYYGFGDIEQLGDLGPEVGLVGFLGDIWAALKVLGLPKPKPLDYPEELMGWMGRRVWKATLGQIRRSVEPTFIKPMDEEKLFTGFIWRGAGMEAVRIAQCDDDVGVWCSEPVEFVSEHRVYIKDDEILGVYRYKGDWSVVPDRLAVTTAVKAFRSSPRALSLDFGITKDGKTLLVEANDGYALGNYGLVAPLYAQLLEARWEELTRA